MRKFLLVGVLFGLIVACGPGEVTFQEEVDFLTATESSYYRFEHLNKDNREKVAGAARALLKLNGYSKKFDITWTGAENFPLPCSSIHGGNVRILGCATTGGGKMWIAPSGTVRKVFRTILHEYAHIIGISSEAEADKFAAEIAGTISSWRSSLREGK